ncbi:Arc family DNA-binding protein [Xenorhabdus entomophaga]|uniref:Arc family DNA-binding protein n=1 Tax=Xenorhabdus entomophaga TaxID=3136257 RepID=UPI0030F3F9C0
MSRIAPYPLRMPPELREALEEKAEKSMRSLQQEVIYHIDMSLQLEKLLAAAPPSSDNTYTRVAKALRLEREVEKKDKEIEKLKMQVSLLAESTKISDMAKLDVIRKNIEMMKSAISKIETAIPPETITVLDKKAP